MNTTTITITDREDLRPGDVATFEYVRRDGTAHPFTGPLWTQEGQNLTIGGYPVRFSDGEWSRYYRFVSATRTVPDLPTEPGSIIHVYESRGERFEKPVLAVLDELKKDWFTPTAVDGYYWHHPEHIIDWRNVEIVEMQP